ncbi:MAG: 50S ribosomal protein L37ae [Thermoplasmata archaeon]
MSKRTKKVGNTGWMGSRYGIRIRRRVLELDRARSKPASCPRCSTVTIERVASGVFECRRCHTRFASGAYLFSPPPPIARIERSAPASKS